MPADLHPEDVLKSLEKGQLAPFYLFYGPGEFRLEKTLGMIREGFIPEAARDLNLELFYGGEMRSSEIINRALSLPFLAQNRLIIVRRTENFKVDELANFVSYLDNPSEWHKKNRGIFYTVNQEIVHMDIASRSLYIVSKYIDITDEEAQAIRYHDGQYIDENKIVAHKEEPLTLLLHWADYWTAHIHENGRELRGDDAYYQLQRVAS